MGTISQELTRIQGGVSDVWDYCEENGVTIPAGTTIDAAKTFLNQIPHGSSNTFFDSPEISNTFRAKTNSTYIMDGLKALADGNAQITLARYAFQSFKDKKIDNKIGFSEYMHKILKKCENADMTYALAYYDIDADISDVQVLDLTDIEFKNNCDHMLYNINNDSGLVNLVVVCNKDTFAQATNADHLFALMKRGKICFQESTINLSCNPSGLFYESNMSSFYNENEEHIDHLNININSQNDIQLNQIFNSTTYTNYPGHNLTRINFNFNGGRVTYYNYAFYNLLSSVEAITGLDFSNSQNNYIFNNSGSNLYQNLGEIGIMQGSTVKSALDMRKVWAADKSTVRGGQTIEYWYEKFANALGQKTVTSNVTITINTTLYNSLTQAQIELITDKGYNLAYAS